MAGKVITCYVNKDYEIVPNDEVLHFSRCSLEYRGWYRKTNVYFGECVTYKLNQEELNQYIEKLKNK